MRKVRDSSAYVLYRDNSGKVASAALFPEGIVIGGMYGTLTAAQARHFGNRLIEMADRYENFGAS